MKSKSTKYNQPEYILQCSFTDYIDKNYPYINYCASITGINIGKSRGAQASRKGVRKGYPDYAIYEPNAFYSGLFIEFKARGKCVKKKSDQERVIDNLRRKGYCVYWVDDYTLAIALLNWYLRLPKADTQVDRPIFTDDISNTLKLKSPTNSVIKTISTAIPVCIDIS